jgi:hypothetical protein
LTGFPQIAAQSGFQQSAFSPSQTVLSGPFSTIKEAPECRMEKGNRTPRFTNYNQSNQTVDLTHFTTRHQSLPRETRLPFMDSAQVTQQSKWMTFEELGIGNTPRPQKTQLNHNLTSIIATPRHAPMKVSITYEQF